MTQPRTALNVLSNGLDCGTCTACCDILGIPELGKPFYSRCKHLTDRGCGIYNDPARPAACGTFQCAWHAGVFGTGAERRPDRIGLMFDLCPGDNPPRINVWEIIPGALQSDRLQYLIKKMREHRKVRNVRFGRNAVILYPYGAKMGVPFEISDDYAGWKQPVSRAMQVRPVGPAHPDQVWFAGEIEPLRMPRKQDTAPTAPALPTTSAE